MIEKMKMHTEDIVQQNIARIRELFPSCVTEAKCEKGKLKLAVDFDQLRSELSECIVEGSQERYHLNWPGKRKALLIANAPISKTLRPCQKQSVNFDMTENLFIEGDNLEALKLLQETYLSKVKMIYIDPPYNTGKDFLYNDNFTKSTKQFLLNSNTIDEYSNRLVANPETYGRFHSDWLTMMYSRLKLARNLLKDDGVIFISIDDSENHNLRKLTEEIFSQNNFLAELVWHLSSGPQAGHFTRSNESIIAFAKNKNNLPYFNDYTGGVIQHGALKKISVANPASEILFPKGSIRCDAENVEFENELGGSEKQFVTEGNLRFVDGLLAEDVRIKAGWAMKNQLIQWLNGKETFDSKGQKVNRFYFNSKGILFYEKERGTLHPKSVISSSEVGGTKAGGDEIIDLFGEKIMSFPKPSSLVKFLTRLVCQNNDDIILDFFAGSATTAHAVIEQNAEDGLRRKFIVVQLPEACDEKSAAHKAGYKSIAEIGKERIRRAGQKILKGNYHEKWNKDTGFRVLKIDLSNMEDVYDTPNAIQQSKLKLFADNIKADRKSDDLLFQVLLDWGVDLSLPIRTETVRDKKVFFVNKEPYDLIACFDNGITEELAKELAQYAPMRIVFKDNGFVSDTVKINVDQVIRQLSPATDVKSI